MQQENRIMNKLNPKISGRSLSAAGFVVLVITFIPGVNSAVRDCPETCSCTEYKKEVGQSELYYSITCTDGGNISNTNSGIELFLQSYQVKSLTLRRYSFEEIPPVVCKMTDLEILDISHNKLTYLPVECLRKLIMLREFDASLNNITRFEKTSSNKHKLAVTPIFTDFGPNLNVIDIRFNKLDIIDSIICKMQSLSSILLDGNKITEIPFTCIQDMRSLQYFSASRNLIRRLNFGIFYGHLSLQWIYLSSNKIEYIYISANSTKSLPSLKVLDLSNNHLKVLDIWLIQFDPPPEYLTINLSYNNITQFSNTLEVVMNLPLIYHSLSIKKTLDLSNQLTVQRISNIMDGWKFKSFGDFENWMISVELNFQGWFYCDCQEYHLISYLRQHPAQYEYMYEYADHKELDTSTGLRLLQMHCLYPPLHPVTTTDLLSITASDIPFIDMVCNVTTDCPPKCTCINRPHNETMHVQCSNTGLLSPPTTVPDVMNYTFSLDFSYNSGLQLEPRDYFQNTSILDLSHCKLTNITDKAWKSMDRIKSVYLHDNLLTTLPQSVVNVNWSSLQELSLYNNSWNCSCDNKWIKSFLESIKSHIILLNPLEIRCSTPSRLYRTSLLSVREDEFCFQQSVNILEIILSLAASCLLMFFVTIAILYLLRVRLYTKWNIHPFHLDECHGEDMEFDAFICCSSNDEDDRCSEGLIAFLESKNFKICYHRRDFIPGETIFENISSAVNRSKRALFLLSPHFIASQYCMLEFEFALTRDLRLGKKRIIAVMLHPLHLDDESVSDSLKFYILRHTYLDCSSEDYRDQLLYAMPINKLGNVTQPHTVNEERDVELQPHAIDEERDAVFLEVDNVLQLQDDDVPLIDVTNNNN